MLSKLDSSENSRPKKKRVGRGPGSTLGKTCGKGQKGQKSRSGYSRTPGFEGGQMPLHRRLPKRGFTNIFKKQYTLLTLSDLEKMSSALNAGEIKKTDLVQLGVIRDVKVLVKVLANGEITKKVTIEADKVSAAAKEKIESVGGSVNELIK